MPWIIATTLTVFIPLVIVYVYVGRTLFRSLVFLEIWNPRRIRILMVSTLSCVNLLPPVMLISF
ncbi:MAG: hypothetical protein WD295_06910, partial [Bacteroidota bacterium]